MTSHADGYAYKDNIEKNMQNYEQQRNHDKQAKTKMYYEGQQYYEFKKQQ